MVIEEAFPLDDFQHVSGMDCACQPSIESLPALGIPATIVHRRITAETDIPDIFPEKWEEELRP